MRIADYLSKQTKISLFVMRLLLVIAVGIIDCLLGEDVYAALFYLIPIPLVVWFIGRRAGDLQHRCNNICYTAGYC